MDYLCPSCGELLTWRKEFNCWGCLECGWFTRTKDTLESCMKADLEGD